VTVDRLFSLRFRASFRHLTRHPWQIVLTVMGVALGVAVMVSLDLAIQSSRAAFQVSQETVTGRASHQVRGGATGLPNELPARLSTEAGLRFLAPVIEGYGYHPEHPDRLLHVLGIDPISEGPFRPFLAGTPGAGSLDGTRLLTEPGSVLLSRETAEGLGVGEGDEFSLQVGGRTAGMTVIGILEAEDEWSRRGLRDLLIVDLAEGQELLDRPGRLDRIDLLIDEADEDEMLSRVEALLPPGATVEPAGDRTRSMQEMIRAFDLNLTALSLLGLIFGVFLIYNTMTFSVIQRRPVFGTLRALGVTRGEILKGILAEAAILGAAGAIVGILLGILLGRGLVGLVTRTINDLYFVVSVEGLALPPDVLLRGGLLGFAATLLATLPPALEATTVQAREALMRSTVESQVRKLLPRAARVGCAMLLTGTALLLLTERSIVAAFAGLFSIILGAALIVPVATIGMAGISRPLLRRTFGIIGGMAARGVVTSMSRTAPAVAALVVAVSVTVGLGIMIESFRGSVVRWLDVTLQADLYISAPSVVSARPGGELPPGFVQAVPSTPGIAGVSTYRGSEFTSGYGLTRLVALDLHPLGEDVLDFLSGGGPEALTLFRAGEGALISEPFSFRHDLQPGDTVSLPADTGVVPFPILGVFRDYGSEAGTVMIGRTAWDREWGDPAVTSLAVFLEDGQSPEETAALLTRLAGPDAPVIIRQNRELRALSLEVFDRTFEVTRVLRLLAFLVAFIAVLSALMALQLERTRELGVLRANGMTPAQGRGLIILQTGLMGTISGILALPVGFALAWIMIGVVNRRSFGWTIDMQVSAGLPAQALLLALSGALLAGVYPAWKLSRTSPSEALKEG